MAPTLLCKDAIQGDDAVDSLSATERIRFIHENAQSINEGITPLPTETFSTASIVNVQFTVVLSSDRVLLAAPTDRTSDSGFPHQFVPLLDHQRYASTNSAEVLTLEGSGYTRLEEIISTVQNLESRPNVITNRSLSRVGLKEVYLYLPTAGAPLSYKNAVVGAVKDMVKFFGKPEFVVAYADGPVINQRLARIDGLRTLTSQLSPESDFVSDVKFYFGVGIFGHATHYTNLTSGTIQRIDNLESREVTRFSVHGLDECIGEEDSKPDADLLACLGNTFVNSMSQLLLLETGFEPQLLTKNVGRMKRFISYVRESVPAPVEWEEIEDAALAEIPASAKNPLSEKERAVLDSAYEAFQLYKQTMYPDSSSMRDAMRDANEGEKTEPLRYPAALDLLFSTEFIQQDVRAVWSKRRTVPGNDLYFQGSESILDYASNFNLVHDRLAFRDPENPDRTLTVQRGWHRQYCQLVETVPQFADIITGKGDLGREPLRIYGHSLGASVACIAALYAREYRPEREVTVVTFGMPRTFGSAAAAYFDRVVKHDRVVNRGDLVPFLLIPSFTHVGRLVVVDRKGVRISGREPFVNIFRGFSKHTISLEGFQTPETNKETYESIITALLRSSSAK